MPSDMSGISSSDELLQRLSAAETSMLEGDSAILRDLEELTKQLEQVSPSVSSANEAFRQMREYIRHVMSSVALDATVGLLATTLYLRLISKASLTYEELMFSTCTHHVSRILKDAAGFKCTSTCNAKNFVCIQSSHIPLIRFQAFLREFVALIRFKAQEFRSQGFTSIALQCLGDFVAYARGPWHHAPLLEGVDAILSESDLRVHATLFKVLLPIVRMSLPSRNQATLIDVVHRTAATEGGTSGPLENNRDSCSGAISEDERKWEVEAEGRGSSICPSTPLAHRLPVLRFLEMCTLQVLDRADQRASLSSLIIRVLRCLPECDVRDFSSFVLKASRHPKARVRLFAVEIAAAFLSRSRGLSSGLLHTRTPILRMLKYRVNDRVPSVRVRAIASLAEMLKDINPDSEAAVWKEVVEIALSLVDRMRDSKSRVRKSAVDFIGLACRQLLDRRAISSAENRFLPIHGSGSDDGDDFQLLSDNSLVHLLGHLTYRGMDTVSTVRIAAISQMTRVIRILSGDMEESVRRKIFRLWCDAVLPHSDDVDSRCSELCLKSVQAVLFPASVNFSPGAEMGWEASSYARQFLTDLFLSEIGSGLHTAAQLGKKSFRAISKKGMLGCREIECLCKKAQLSSESEELSNTRKGAWIVLAEVSSFGYTDFLKKALPEEYITKEVLSFGNRSACKIFTNLIGTMTSQCRTGFALSLETTLFTEGIIETKDNEFIIAAVEVLSNIRVHTGSDLIDRSVKLVVTVEADVEDRRNEKLLCLIGSICVFFGLTKPPPQSVLTFVRALVSNSTKSSKIRAFALATLGKICLCQSQSQNGRDVQNAHQQNDEDNTAVLNNIGETLTRRHISVFVHELENATSSATKNNAVIVLCDLCRIYTAVAEPYMARLAELLSDPSPFIRVQVLSSILSLFQEDYIKLRSGPILFQVAKCLVDPSETVRETAEYGLLRVAAPKNSSIMGTSFIELIFVLNECKECSIYNQSSNQGGKASYSKVPDGFEHRRKVYEVFLDGMTIEHRLRLAGRFRSEVLSPIVDGKLQLSTPSVESVLGDTLNLLACMQHRFNSERKRSEESTDNSPIEAFEAAKSQQTMPANDRQVTTGLNLVNKVQLLELRETTIPALLEMRHHLENLRSPMLKVLMRCMCSLLRPHRRDLESLITDSVVRIELQHEMSAMVQKKGPEDQSLRKGVEVNEDTPDGHRCREIGAKRPDASHGTPRNPLSVPRTRPTRRLKKLSISHSDSEDDNFMLEYGEEDRARQFSRRIEGSPKLAALASRSNRKSPKTPFAIHVDEKPSGFALALARIEDEAKL